MLGSIGLYSGLYLHANICNIQYVLKCALWRYLMSPLNSFCTPAASVLQLIRIHSYISRTFAKAQNLSLWMLSCVFLVASSGSGVDP